MALQTFEYKSKLNAPCGAVFAWHEAPGAFERLSPPWIKIEVLERIGGINGGTVTLLIRQGPAFIKWKLEHDPKQFIAGQQFRDYQVEGPFKTWSQIHRVEPDGENSCYLIDRVEFELPDLILATFIAEGYIQNELRRLFQYRHRVIAQDLEESARYQGGMTMKVLVSGSTGLIGSALIPCLTTKGYTVTRLVRPQTRANPDGSKPVDSVIWDPSKLRIDPDKLAGFDAVIHLAGDSVAGGRWTSERKTELRNSRVPATKFLAETLAKLKKKPSVFICASAIGYYGPRGSEALNESATKGSGFLADLCQDWESATRPASEAGIRVVLLRTGLVLSPTGGALQQMLLPFQFGAGGQIGDGKQYYSWITLDDECGAIVHALETDSLRGPVNITAPHPVTNKEFTKTLGSVLSRPTLIPIPPFGLRALFGEMADELFIGGQNVRPEKLENSGYRFREAELEPALRHLLGK
jgi:uncharacterized protein (TIGR01777 family)